MGNKIKILIFLPFILLVLALPVIAQEEASPTAKLSPSLTSGVNDKINELKEKVAEKVTELKEKELKVLIGSITDKKDDQITLLTQNGEETIQTDGNTRFSWINTDGKILKLSAKDFVIDDFLYAKGTYIPVSKTLTAQTLTGRLKMFFYTGRVEKMDATNSLLTIIDQKKNTIEIKTSKKPGILSENNLNGNNLSVSDITKNQIIIVRGYEEKQQSFAQRILILK